MNLFYNLLTVAALLTPMYAVADNIDLITVKLNVSLPNNEIESLVPVEDGELYSVLFSNGERIYITPSGNHFVAGELWTIADLTPTNITIAENVETVNNISDHDLVVFKAPKELFSITVFTDITCEFCQKLHSEIDELNQLGITVRYAAYPRSGKRSHAYRVMESIWCADDPKKALTEAKLGRSIPSYKCNNPVEKQYNLGRHIKLTGTPTIIYKTGIIRGYRSPSTLLTILTGKTENQ